MKHIFFTHSNITSIVIYESVLELITREEDVTIITYRGQQWPFEKNVNIVDFSDLFISTQISVNYYRFISSVRKKMKDIIREQSFFFYLPTSFDIICQQFQKDKHCEKYFYIEEGTLSYGRGGNYFGNGQKGFFKKNIKKILGIYTEDFIISDKFGGTIAISDKAFKWNKKNKKINNPYSYVHNVNKNQISYQNIIVFGYLNSMIDDIKKLIDITFEHIVSKGINSVAIKFHPRSYYVHEGTIKELYNYIIAKHQNIILLDRNYLIEKTLFLNHANIYSIQDASSLMIYALISNGSAFLSRFNCGELITNTYNSLEEYAKDFSYLDI